MSRSSKKAGNLVNRFPFTDLSRAVSRTGDDRRQFLDRFVNGPILGSYKATRLALPGIYGVVLGLDASAPPEWPHIEQAIRRKAARSDVERNLNAAAALFSLVRDRGYAAYHHEAVDLPFGLDRRAPIGLNYHIIDGDDVVFQYAHLRATPLSAAEIAIMGSMIHYAYVDSDPDYANARVEIADVSIPRRGEGRWARITTVSHDQMMSREELQLQIDDIYAILIAMAVRKAA